MRTILRLVIVLLSTGALTATGMATEQSTAPAGWSAGGSHPAEYEMGLDPATRRSGRSSAVLRGKTPTKDGFGTLMQQIDAADYRGRRVRLSGFSKAAGVAGWAGLWMRVDGPQGVLALDNMQSRPIKGTADWKRCEVVLDVPSGAGAIWFGLLLSGPGQVWFDDLQLEAVDGTVPVTAATSQR
jgi:hypothetical protein